MTRTKSELDEVALSTKEYERIVSLLGRSPNDLELGLFGALWSEHCGYKHTKLLLKKLPSKSDKTLVSAGEENAGVLSFSKDLCVVFKVESHNHPSAVEPTQGAATGVGGIVRDVLAMGARPIALLNSLRFGNLKDARQRYLFEGVVSGISSYGNCIGVPDVGGELFFDESYLGNPLVNAMCVGLVERDKIMRACAKDAGDKLVLVGSLTGRDGIHGASGLASRSFASGEADQKAAVQIGDPFMEKVLIEACLEVKNVKGVNGIQDCGAAGISSAVVEMASRSNLGVDIDVSKIPARVKGMTPYEFMLSESQERMLIAIDQSALKSVEKVFFNWGLEASVIGEFNNSNKLKVTSGEDVICDVLVEHLVNPPMYEIKAKIPTELKNIQKSIQESIQENIQTGKVATKESSSVTDDLLKLLSSPNIASKKGVYQRYDHMVQNRTVIRPEEGEASVLRIDKKTGQGLALSIDCNPRYCELNPYEGSKIAVAEACRNLSMVGAKPVGLTDCLNFGDPSDELVKYQLVQSIEGIKDAANAFQIPVVSGNVSLYNKTKDKSIAPTPVIGAVGVVDNVAHSVKNCFVNEGDYIFVLGSDTPWCGDGGLAGSEYQKIFFGGIYGNPVIDLQKEVKLQALCRDLVSLGLLNSARDVALGGLYVCLTKCAVSAGVGFKVNFGLKSDPVEALFGESQSRIVVSAKRENEQALVELGRKFDTPIAKIGEVFGTMCTINSYSIELDRCVDSFSSKLY